MESYSTKMPEIVPYVPATTSGWRPTREKGKQNNAASLLVEGLDGRQRLAARAIRSFSLMLSLRINPPSERNSRAVRE
jgi:hypothetical protein